MALDTFFKFIPPANNQSIFFLFFNNFQLNVFPLPPGNIVLGESIIILSVIDLYLFISKFKFFIDFALIAFIIFVLNFFFISKHL